MFIEQSEVLRQGIKHETLGGRLGLFSDLLICLYPILCLLFYGPDLNSYSTMPVMGTHGRERSVRM